MGLHLMTTTYAGYACVEAGVSICICLPSIFLIPTIWTPLPSRGRRDGSYPRSRLLRVMTPNNHSPFVILYLDYVRPLC